MVHIDKKQIIVISNIADLKPNKGYQIWQPTADIFETQENFIVKVEAAGMKEENFSINYSSKTLRISGYRSNDEQEGSYHRMEIPYGEFSTNTHIPIEIDTNCIEATYDKGFLTVILPKSKSVSLKITEE